MASIIKMMYNMGMDKKTRTRLTMDQKLRAIAYIARGDTMSQVAAHMLEDYEVSITESALYNIKRDNRDTIQKIQERLADSAAADAEKILHSSRVAIAKKIQKADRDGGELELLDQQYRDGEIGKDEYQRRKAGMLQLSIGELVNINRSMYAQTVQRPSDPELPPGNQQQLPAGSATPAQLEALLKAIQAGNTVEIQRLIFTPGGGQNDQHVAISQ